MLRSQGRFAYRAIEDRPLPEHANVRGPSYYN